MNTNPVAGVTSRMICTTMPPRRLTTKRDDPSAYAIAGDVGRRTAQRELLLKALADHDWNMTQAAKAIGLSGAPRVIRALRDVAPDVYKEARADGRIRAGARSQS